jgi:hypothetical protein
MQQSLGKRQNNRKENQKNPERGQEGNKAHEISRY